MGVDEGDLQVKYTLDVDVILENCHVASRIGWVSMKGIYKL